MEYYTIATAGTWAGEEYPSARGEYAPTPVCLTLEYMKLEEGLEKIHSETVHQLEAIEDRWVELIRMLEENEKEREALATTLQEAGKAHQQKWPALEERRLSLL